MLTQILAHFPPRTHALTLVSDPDDILADEDFLTALSDRGFTLVRETDPVALRHRVEQARPWSVDRPLIVVTNGPLDELPYDLWQQGHHVTLALHAFFPRLAYPVVRALTPTQRPPRRLGRRATVEFLLRHVFAAELDALQRPASLVAWLDQYHQWADPMPDPLADHLLLGLRENRAYADWPLAELVASRESFEAFVRDQWRAYVQRQTGQLLGEEPVRYVCLLDFEADHALQDALPGLVRSGTLAPVGVNRPGRLPQWARPAVLAPDEDRRARRAAELLGVLEEHLDLSLPPGVEQALASARWERWRAVARAWAELTALRHDPDGPLDAAQVVLYRDLQREIDAAFLVWLRRRYAPLGSQRLPAPHHVHHVPHYIAYRRRQGATGRVALVILDGLALADWVLVGGVWRARHPDWRFDERLLLAQVPTITAVSRQALVGGLRPADFAPTLGANRAEPRRWAAFWAREGLDEDACPHVRLGLEYADVGHASADVGRAFADIDGASAASAEVDPPSEVSSARTRALCLIENRIDDLVHDATLGAIGFQAALRVWLEGDSRRLEAVLVALLARGFAVYLTSDHGHVEARGFGRPSEGLTVDTRGRRARVYSDWRAAEKARGDFPETVLWHDDGLLPDDAWVLMPKGRQAFATFNETSVTHGGLTLDEVVVPLVTITGRDTVGSQ